MDEKAAYNPKGFKHPQPEQERASGRKRFIIAAIAVIVLAALLLPSRGGLRESFKRSVCEGQVLKIGLALAAYAKDNDGFLPLGDIGEAMTMLRRLDYLDYKLLSSLSPYNTRPGRTPELDPESIPFIYFGGGETFDKNDSARIVLCDIPGKHRNFGHVLFADGHVEGRSGSDWFEKLEIKEKLATAP